MIAYILRSLAQAVMVMLAVALLAFAMFRFVGDPVANMVGQEASVAERTELAERLGLNDPFPIQFAHFVRDVARGGRGEVTRLGWWTTGLLTETGRKSLIMPVLTLGFFQLTLIMRLVRAEMLEALRTDYVKFARARGIPERSISFRHALRNTMIPVITIAGLQFGSVIAFPIVTETVFQWPGLGALFVQAVQFVDIPVMAAYLMFVALGFVVVNLAVDLLYFAVG